MQAMLLGGADSSTKVNAVLQTWFGKVKAVVYQTEDLLDDYSYEILKRRLALRNQHQRLRFHITTILQFHPRFVFRLQMAHRIKFLRLKVAQVYSDAKDVGIKPAKIAYDEDAGGNTVIARTPAEEQLRWRREQVAYEGMVGREDDQDMIIDLICHPHNNNSLLSLVGIHGMAGLGKTALCRSILQKELVSECFKEQIWICVSHDFNLDSLLKSMVEQLFKEASTISDIEAIKRKLQDKLQGEKYLLVLDDVWETFTKVWDVLKSSLEEIGGAKGTTVLVTSRSKQVLNTLQTSSEDPSVYELRKLTEEGSWDLFQPSVGDHALSDSRKISLAKEMLRKCEGVPLAIKTIGALLRSRNRIQDWKDIEKSELWNKDDNSYILPSVKLSFKYLPNVSLKRCFAYCGIFREDEIIEKEMLIQLWMANDLLHPYDKAEDIGEGYIDVLLNSSLFQDAKFDKDLGRVISFKMHDVVHSLARQVHGPELCTLQEKYSWEIGAANDHGSRHLRLDSELGELSVEIGSNLRTLFTSFDILSRKRKLWVNTIYLHALSLVGVGLKELPDSIGELKHLRYLDVSHNNISILPNGLTKLHNLQTLRKYKTFPKLPREFYNLINLRHICSDIWHEVDIPVGLGMLTRLQTLPTLQLRGTSPGKLSELGTLTNLKGNLCINGLEKATIEELEKMNLGSKQNIEKLDLEWWIRSMNPKSHQEVLEALEPHPNLAALRIKNNNAETLPKWVMEMTGRGGSPLCNLVSLVLDFCKATKLPLLLNLVALKSLHISSCRCVISPVDLNHLPSLEELTITYCATMQNLTDISRPLPHLQVIRLQYCLGMTALPAGLANNLPNLKELHIGPFNKELNFLPFLDKDIITNSSFPISNSLEKLTISGNSMDKVTSLPDKLQYLVALKDLSINNIHSLEILPEWLGNLACLKSLLLSSLDNLKCLPSHAVMANLIHLNSLFINQSRLLEKACDPLVGSEWPKIQHIPLVKIRKCYTFGESR